MSCSVLYVHKHELDAAEDKRRKLRGALEAAYRAIIGGDYDMLENIEAALEEDARPASHDCA